MASFAIVAHAAFSVPSAISVHLLNLLFFIFLDNSSLLRSWTNFDIFFLLQFLGFLDFLIFVSTLKDCAHQVFVIFLLSILHLDCANMVTASQLQILQFLITGLVSTISTFVNVTLDDSNYLNW